MRFMLTAGMGHAGLFIHECALSLVRRRARGPISLTEGRKGLGEGEHCKMDIDTGKESWDRANGSNAWWGY